MKVAVHEDWLRLFATAARVQGLPVKLPVTPFWEKDTVPVGFVGVAELSVTVAVHVVGLFALTGEGAQLTAVPVGWLAVTVRVAVPTLAS